jgi:hypothetical protein
LKTDIRYELEKNILPLESTAAYETGTVTELEGAEVVGDPPPATVAIK